MSDLLKDFPISNNDTKQIWLKFNAKKGDLRGRDVITQNTAYIDINTPSFIIKKVIDSIKITNEKDHSKIIQMFISGIIENGYTVYKDLREVEEETYDCFYKEID